MEKGTVKITTNFEHHWAIDNPQTEITIMPKEQELVIESVGAEIKKHHKESNAKDRETQLKDKPNSLEILSLSKSINRISSHKRNYFKVFQKWVGYITEVNGECFVARLKDLTNGGADEEAEILIDDISPEDKQLISIGAVFYWSIGKEMFNGQVKKESIIRFKRAPWEVDEVDNAFDLADELLEGLKWE